MGLTAGIAGFRDWLSTPPLQIKEIYTVMVKYISDVYRIFWEGIAVRNCLIFQPQAFIFLRAKKGYRTFLAGYRTYGPIKMASLFEQCSHGARKDIPISLQVLRSGRNKQFSLAIICVLGINGLIQKVYNTTIRHKCTLYMITPFNIF